MARYKCDRDLLIPKVQVHHSVTGAPKRSIGKQDITGQSAELGPKNAVRLMAVLEHTLPPSQPTIESKNELRPRWPLVAVCSRQNLNATHGTPEVPPLVWYWKNPMSTEGGRTSQFSIKEREQPRGILTERLSFRVHHRHRRLLCSRRRRPRRRRAAEQRDELTALHSITSSAAASSLSGTVRPSALAVLRLSTNSNLVDRTTGRSAGLSPLRICPA